MTVEELNEVLRRNVRARRTELGLTQTQLSELSGIAQARIAVLESGKHVPTLDTIVRLARALKVPPDALLRPGIFSGIPA